MENISIIKSEWNGENFYLLWWGNVNLRYLSSFCLSSCKYSHYILGELFFEDHSIPDDEEESDNWVFTALKGVKITLLVVIMFYYYFNINVFMLLM